MKLDDISTIEGASEWKAFLMDKPKEELVEFILDKMVTDFYFFKTAQTKFIKFEGSFDELVSAYCDEVDNEISNRNPDGSYIEMLSYDFLEREEEFEDLLSQVKIHMIVARKLEEAMDNGAGFYDGCDANLGDMVRESEERIFQLIMNKLSLITIEQYIELRKFFDQESTSNASFDYDGHITKAYKLICENEPH